MIYHSKRKIPTSSSAMRKGGFINKKCKFTEHNFPKKSHKNKKIEKLSKNRKRLSKITPKKLLKSKKMNKQQVFKF